MSLNTIKCLFFVIYKQKVFPNYIPFVFQLLIRGRMLDL
jgi:hypothetical protein